MTRRLRLLSLLACAGLASACQTGDRELADSNDLNRRLGFPPRTRAQFDALKASNAREQADFLDQLSADPRFEPREAVLARGAQARRAAFGTMIPPAPDRRGDPVVELFRDTDGRVTLRATDRDGRRLEAAAALEDWTEVTAHEAEALAPRPPSRRYHRGDPLPQVPPVCHPVSVFLEAVEPGDTRRRRYANSCGGEAEAPTFGAAVAMYKLAVERLPGCDFFRREADSMYTLGRCFRSLPRQAPAPP